MCCCTEAINNISKLYKSNEKKKAKRVLRDANNRQKEQFRVIGTCIKSQVNKIAPLYIRAAAASKAIILKYFPNLFHCEK